MSVYRPKRTDANHREFLELLRRCGVMYCDMSGVGRGWPDLLVLVRGVWQLVEIKDGKRRAAKLNPLQLQLHTEIASHGGKVWTLSNIAELENLIGAG